MAFVTADRVKDTSTTTGTGNFTVSGTSPTGYRTFSAVLSAADTFYYCIQGQTTAEWEVGLGTYSSANVFARTTILSSSNSNLVVSFQAGVKNVFITLAADKTLQIGPSSTPVAGSVPYGTGATLAYTAAGTAGQVLTSGGAGSPTWTTVTGTGTVTSVAQTFTGGIVSVGGSPITTSGTLALTVAGTSGGIPYFSSGTTWASSAALTANGVVYGGGAAASPASTAAGTTGQVLIATTSNAPSWGQVPLATGVTGTLPVSNGGTGQSTALTQYGVIYGSSATAMGNTAAGTTGQVLIATTSAAPSWGLVPIAGGGTGLSSTPANGALDIGNGTGFTRTTLTAGSGVTITNGAGSISIAASGGSGTVTSVSVTTANGVSGTVATATTTPAISLSLGDITPTSVALNSDAFLVRDAANILAQRNGVTSQAKRVYNTYTDASNYERGVFDFKTTANVLTIGTEKLGTGATRNIQFLIGGVLKADYGVTSAGAWTFVNNIKTPNSFEATLDIYLGRYLALGSGTVTIYSNTSGILQLSSGIGTGAGFDRLQFGGTTTSFPALKRSTTSLQARLADDSAFTNIQGKLTTDTAYTAGALVATGYITIYDSTGTAYRVPCLV